MRRSLFIWVGICLLGTAAFAQQTGSISGTVTLSDGEALPGVLIEASADVLPKARVATSSATGDYSFPLLAPGNYVLTFTLDGMKTEKRSLSVRLQQNAIVDVMMAGSAVEEEIVVVAAAPMIDTSSAEIKSAIADDVIDALPVGQEYRDLVKLIPGVQYTEDSTRGPSAGGSGQDNVYMFDGVNVNRPMFGTLSAEPSSHDIEQISVVKGGARATDFNRSGGLSINSLSKSGTNQFRGEVSYQVQTDSMTGDRDTASDSEFDKDRDWLVANLGGPVVPGYLNFYASYYRPTENLANRANLYGEVPDSDSTRDEFFGKLSFTPTDSVMIHGSYRDSARTDSGLGVTSSTSAGSTSEGADVDLKIGTLEATWVVNEASFLSLKFTDFEELNSSRPDNIFDFPIRVDGSVPLDVGNLDQQGLFLVPQPIEGEDAFNQFIAPLVNRYGYLENGVPTGGGDVGGASTFNDQDFFRSSWQLGYDYLLGDNVQHELHVGYQYTSDQEDLSRTSNGWGVISVIGGRDTASDGTPIFYEGRFEQMSIVDSNGVVVPPIESEFKSSSFEINDVIKWQNWTFNLGFIFSEDKLYGQGLRKNKNNVSGFELAPGSIYLMKDIGYDEQIQPRLGAVWSWNGRDTLYANYARYYPAASSLPRAASWARNLRRSIRAYFDASGQLIEVDPVGSSSGKVFQEGIDPRSIDELLVGYSTQLTPTLTARVHARYREGQDFWEDTNNNARSRYEPPPGIPTEDYVPNLDEIRDEIGGSSYVIAELDGAYTKYWELSTEAEWRGRNAFVQGSYVWSHYYGNFDQDNSTTTNDADVFIGSSFIADGAGRQLWDFRNGNLRGDRRHKLKLYGFYQFNWDGTAGAYAIYQSGQPWETWDVEVYRHLTGSSSDTSRYAEPAGSRTTNAHHQIDLNYTHNFRFGSRYNVQLRGDIFNIYDNQTGYNIQNKKNSANFGEPRSFFDPRRFQLALRFQF